MRPRLDPGADTPRKEGRANADSTDNFMRATVVSDAAAGDDLERLARHLRARREALLHTWHARVAQDPDVTTVGVLARREFVDHVPSILDALERDLCACTVAERAAAAAAQRQGVHEHGLDRWRHGYRYRDAMREWGHLQTCIADEVEAFTLTTPGLDPRAMSAARRRITELFVECMVESAAGHVRRQEAEAASRLRELEQGLADLQTLERARAELWHEATHDLRGNVGAVQLAAAVLGRSRTPTGAAEAARGVERSAGALTRLLDDLLALARLEAGRELRRIAPFDAAAVVREMCDAYELLARERGLLLQRSLPAALRVEGDATKVVRIAQNLVMNALKYTASGGVQVIVRAEPDRAPSRWDLVIADTGAGLLASAGTPVVRLLRDATPTPPASAAAASEPASTGGAPGEGVGLTIVKRLCELLDAAIAVESRPGRGTTFTVSFPSDYASHP